VDQQVARQVTNIDIIVGAHTHSLLYTGNKLNHAGSPEKLLNNSSFVCHTEMQEIYKKNNLHEEQIILNITSIVLANMRNHHCF
jgi:hypothetical protein